jgi:HD-GYP domain-containing protein (c-di-GMP phosphodiesterase class II)
LQKPGRLSDEEFEIMKSHSDAGHNIVAAAELPEEANWVLHHHERMDGRGYPAGLVGEEIPLQSRIIHVADAFEAITSERPYQARRSVAEAIAELETHTGTQFDARCVAALRLALAQTGQSEPLTEVLQRRLLTRVGDGQRSMEAVA